MNLSRLWNLLQGRKTYLLALTCIAAVIARTVNDSLNGMPIDWERVMHEVFGCLIAMSLRHGLATSSQKGNGKGDGGCPFGTNCRPGPHFDPALYRNFDR
ncbi:MAG: hypothetical protein NZM31_03425 [Gemmatales bacterium]|nr:hypothetical protein [Gemmatales bacterium]MDW8386049.1 hypothetical protein [Gemmatales bacterium]